MNFKQWFEDVGLTHDDYVNKGPYSGIRSKYRTAEDPKPADGREGRLHKVMQKRLKKFGNIDSKLV